MTASTHKLARYSAPPLLIVLCLVLAGCGSDNKPRPPASATNAPQAVARPGRPDTKAIEAAGMVGYDGKQMRKAVDKALDKTEERNKELENAMKE